MKSYIQQIRQKLGHDLFIHPAARIIVENQTQQVLIIERLDNGQIGLPAGGLEHNETIEVCIKREVFEETGLRLNTVRLIGISSQPELEKVVYPNGDQIQYFTMEFYSNQWSGEIKVQDLTEVKKAYFTSKEGLQALPKNEKHILESWAHFKNTGQILLS